MQIFLSENSVPLQGTRQLTVRWYSTAVGGFPENTEVLQAQFTDGYASIVLGTTDPVSDTMLMRGTVWVGLQLDSDPEYSPRTMVLSTPFARIAQRAIEAQSLSKEVTGVVTSVNEIAGNVILVGGVGIAVARRGPIITISSTDLVETGEVFGTDTDFEFVIIPKTKISSSSCVTVNVSSATTSISATIVNIDPINNVVRIRTAAPLLRDESVRWSVHR
ncbi:MAG: hypothetical protein HQ472_07725 [Ignavibacteria bacterium]|nr:hypothetical protein [Ignavibacteria bacterium]